MNLRHFSIVFVSALASFSALAAPKVGDTATMTGTFVGSGLNAPASSTQKILSHNPNSGIFGVEQTTALADRSQTQQKNVAEDDLMSEEMAAQIVEMCEAASIGRRERVTTRAGSFETCRATAQDGATTIWIGSVPFGMVKLKIVDQNGEWNLSLDSFVRGN